MLIDQPNKPARDVVVTHYVDEIDIMEKLGIIAANANSKFQENESNKQKFLHQVECFMNVMSNILCLTLCLYFIFRIFLFLLTNFEFCHNYLMLSFS